MQIVFKAGTASSEQMRRLAVCNHWHAMHYLNVFAACSLHLSQDWRFRKNSLSLVNMSWQFIPLSTFQQSQVLLECIEEFQYHPSSTQHSEVLLASIVQLPSPDFKQDCWVQRWYAGGRWGLFPRSFRPYSYIAPSYLQWLFVWLCPYLPLLSTAFVLLPSLYPAFPSSFSPLNPLPLSSSYYDGGSALACLGPSAHQAFLMLLHSAAAARETIVSSFPLSHCGCDSCSCLQGSSVCRQPPSEVKSHRDYSLIPGDFKIFLRDDVRHVKSRRCRQERKCGKIKAFWRKTAIME